VESNTRNTIDDFGQIYRIFGKDGSERWIDDYTHIRRDSSGNPTHYEGLILDITDRKKAENALVLESQRMESLLALSQMSQKADAGIISEVVEDAIRLTGSTIGYLATLNDDESVMTMKYWSKSAHVSCSIIDKPIVYDVEKTGLWGEAVRQRTSVITNDYTADSPFKRGTPKGHVPLVRHMNIPVFDGDHIVAVAGVGNKGTDYNEGDVRQLQLLMQGWWQIVIRKRAEDALQNSEGRLRTLLQTIPDLIWLKDAEGAYLSCNSMFERFFGAKEADIVGKTDYDFVDHKLADFFRENDRKAMAASGPTSNEEWITFADDGHRALLDTIKAPVYDEQKSLIGILGIGRDITDRKHAEEERDKVRRWQAGVNHILESVLSSLSLEEKLKVITDGVVDIFGADFCRIWLIDRGDRCDAGCMHAGVIQGPHVCRFRDKCLHLRASSGRYTHLDGKGHGRVPFGAYKIGRIASGEEVKFLTNDVEHDPRVHDHAWAKSLGLVAFAGYRLKPHDGDVLGVFALFAKFPISPDMDAILEGLSRAISLAIQKDLTDQILKESEMRLNEVSEMAHVGGWEYDLSTKEVRWTKETYRIHEVPEGTGFNLASATLFYDMPGRSALETSLQQCMEHAEPFDLELPFTSAGGKHLWTRVMGQAVKTDGRIVKLMGTFQNITERKQSDEALRESRQLFADIISFLPDPTFVIDKEGLVLAWNLALEQLSGVPAKEIIGKGNYEYSIWLYGKRRPVLIDLVLKPDQDAARQNYTDIHWEASTVTAQTVFIPSVTGRKTPLSLVASPLIDSQGNTTGAIESMRDISHVKEAETALALLNANLELIVKERTQKLQDEVVQRMQAEKDVKAALDYTRSVIEANPDLVVVLDEAGVILDVNGAGETLTGIPTQQLIGTPYFGYLIEDGTVQSAFAGLLEEGTIENFVRIRRTDGHITPLSVHATVIRGKDGTKDQIIVSAHDITRQKLDEEAIRASLDEKVLLLREVHHRVKNNLQIIISLVNLQMRQTDDPEVKQIMSETQNRVRAMSLVHEKLYRSESLSRIDFADYTRFLATQLFSFYGVDSRRVNLDLTMSRIMVDINTAVPLGLLMNELISNALKHAFPQGREGTIKISGGEKGDLITLAVQDNGVGMAADLDWKNTTSLGMRLITSLTDQVDGVIELDRENGTTFIITIPQKQHPASS
jgi:PAS domain S-box-containing protein